MGRWPAAPGRYHRGGPSAPDTRERPCAQGPTPERTRPGRDAPDLDPAWRERIRSHLVAWYGEAHRDLPWREDRDPYRILVSEMMLVQTTVAAVVPYFARFLARFPTVSALAEADEAEVLKAWEGLGYYRRARQLHAAARAIVADHGGVFPDDPEAIRALPGVGRYIAGAILSFAFDRPAPIVEANTQRVLARWLAWGEDLKSTRSQARLWEAAGRLVPDDGAGDVQPGIHGAGGPGLHPRGARSAWSARSPPSAVAQALGLQDRLPVATPKAAAAGGGRGLRRWCVGEGASPDRQAGPGRLWEQFWEFPTIHLAGPDPAGRLVRRARSTWPRGSAA